MHEIPIRQVKLDDPFWSPRLELNARRSIFHQWGQLEASGCIDNFRILAGDKPGFREGWFFADSDAYKWLDAAARITATHPSPELTVLMDDLIALLARAQAPDGYLYSYNQIHFPDTRWANLQIEHELYCHGHLIEAGVSHYAATGNNSLLHIARKAADRIVEDFCNAGPQGTDGHEEIELALIRLYRLTGEEAYLAQAQRFIERRGRIRGFAWAIWRQNTRVTERRKIVKELRQTAGYAMLRSHTEATRAQKAGLLAEEIVPVEVPAGRGKTIRVDRDDHLRTATDLEQLGQLPPAFSKDGSVTAGNASGIVDGAAALVIAEESVAKSFGVEPLARLVSWAFVGVEPAEMGIGPAPAIRRALEKAKLELEDLDLFEINEAFAAQYLSVEKELGLDRDTVNVNGGAIALGHPLGCSGARITTTLLNAMEWKGAEVGLATMCIGLGQGIATIIERR